MKRMVIIITMVCLIVALSIQGAMAAAWFPDATVKQVGMGSGTVYIVLTDATVNVNGRWYVADPASANAILAVALTAVSNGSKVQANASSFNEFGTITALYISSGQ
jgi:hypothetical protein